MSERADDFILDLEDVYQEYPLPHGGVKVVLNDIDLRVRRGEFVTIVGPTGAGKTRFFNIALGSEKPSRSKKLLFDGEPIVGIDRNRGIVPQRYSLFPNLTVSENIAFGLRLESFNLLGNILAPVIHRRQLRVFREEAMTYIQRIGLSSDDGDKYPHQLSGGMRQRVAVAQSLVTKPKALFMDEPFGALDDATREVMQLFILEMWEKYGMTIFFVTHNPEEALFLGTRILAISPYYQTDRPDSLGGSKIVIDAMTNPSHPKPPNYKSTAEFNRLLKEIRDKGLCPEQKQHISDFNLSHPDSYRTVLPEEWARR